MENNNEKTSQVTDVQEKLKLQSTRFAYIFMIALIVLVCFSVVIPMYFVHLQKVQEERVQEILHKSEKSLNASSQLDQRVETALREYNLLNQELRQVQKQFEEVKAAKSIFQVPLGTMLPSFSDSPPTGFVYADGIGTWPDENWVPVHLRGKRVPDMTSKVLSGGNTKDVGSVSDTNGFTLPNDDDAVAKARSLEQLPKARGFPNQPLLAVVSKGETMVEFPIYDGLTHATIETKRTVICKWIIRVK
jgi:hypothetical protein